MRTVRRLVDVWAPQLGELLEALDGLAYVAGGAARQIVMREQAPPAEDIDLFLYRVADYETCLKIVGDLAYVSADVSENSVSFWPRDWVNELGVQVIRPFIDEWRDRWRRCYGEPEDVIGHFAFTTEQFAIAGNEAIIGPNAIADTALRRLIVNNVTEPAVVAWRAVKYGHKGYVMEPSEMQRVFDVAEERTCGHR